MNEIQYIGEHLWIGNIGHIAIVLGFVSSIISLLGYSKYTNLGQPADVSWKNVGRWGYWIHIISIGTVISLMFYAMISQYFEYAYVYQHVSSDLPMKYIVSAFWEGQEGSFLLWMIWHLVLGAIIIKRGGFWESPVMAILALTEVFLSSMILGVHVEIGEWTTKFGSNPLILLRDTMHIPLFNNAEYISLLQGTGLNPLLQNYWMTIHPPVTFLGFASTTIPFAFAIAGLWTGKYKEWLKPALPWCLFSGFILGTGILMGSVWAYEALSFGGYWAWDPVENAVLVPWLTLIAGIHTHLVAKNTGYSIRPTIFFYVISMVLIVYSTYLTRSGILGDTSAHAFTEMGLEKQLIAFVLFFLGMGLYFLFKHYKNIPVKNTEESIYSREFWMFVGSLVLLFSGILISVSTSIPVYNAIKSYFDPMFEGNVINDPEDHYNRYQLWIGVFVALLSASTILLRYNEGNWNARKKKYILHISVGVTIAIVGTFVFSKLLNLYNWKYTLLCLTGIFTMVMNMDYIINFLKGNVKHGAAAISHFGFGMMVLGVLASGPNKWVISSSPFIFKDIFEEEDVDKYVQLFKNKPFFAQGYWMTYESDTLIGRHRYYTIDFKETGSSEGEVIEQFKLSPNANYSNDFSKIAAFNPDTKHYLHKDIFTCLASLAPTKMDVQKAKAFEDTLTYHRYDIAVGDTLITNSGNSYKIDDINFEPSHNEYDNEQSDFGVGVILSGWNDKVKEKYKLTTALGLQGNLVYKYPYIEEDLNIRIRLADELMDNMFTPDHKLDYEKVVLKSYNKFEFGGATISLTGFDKTPTDRNYKPKSNDIAIGADMQVIYEGKSYPANPIYIIRDNIPLGVKAYIPQAGIHIKFSGIDPTKEEFTFYIAKDKAPIPDIIPIEIAEQVPRTDYIILQANVFPGINLLWLGCILMMFGLLLSTFLRIKSR